MSQIMEIVDKEREIQSKNKQTEREKFLNFKINIIDTGMGMTPEGLSKLFVNFGKLAENAEMNRGGTGLGLSICKNIIEKMGGSVMVTSEVGQGTTFSINLKTKCISRPTHLLEKGRRLSQQDFVSVIGEDRILENLDDFGRVNEPYQFIGHVRGELKLKIEQNL